MTYPPSGKVRWRCLVCEEKGTAPSEVVARSVFDMHYRITHYVARKAGA